MCFYWQDINRWTEVIWIICGLLWCFYELFGLSFWRHPYTAEDPLVSKRWNAPFLQICFDEETNSFTCSIFIINICEYKPKLIHINRCTYSDDLIWTAGFICVTYLRLYELFEAWQFLLRGRVWTKTIRKYLKWLHLCSKDEWISFGFEWHECE